MKTLAAFLIIISGAFIFYVIMVRYEDEICDFIDRFNEFVKRGKK